MSKQTKLSQQEMQSLLDEQTVFSLAVLMVDFHVASQIKNKQQLVNSMLKAGVVIRNNPGFIPRFKAAQQAIIDHVQKSTPNGLVAPIVTVFDEPTSLVFANELNDDQIEELAGIEPPPSEL